MIKVTKDPLERIRSIGTQHRIPAMPTIIRETSRAQCVGNKGGDLGRSACIIHTYMHMCIYVCMARMTAQLHERKSSSGAWPAI